MGPKRIGQRPRLDYGRAIETLRVSKGLGREETARLARISPSYLREIELGLKRPSTDVVSRVARGLGMKGSAFLQYVEEVSAPPSDDEKLAPAVQLTLRRAARKRTKDLPLFSVDQDGERHEGARKDVRDREAETDLTFNELQVIARRLGADDRLALLQLARHLLRR
ncbi:MAG TPA: helix-turn-helix transcriptional regulator [bacterium]|nr:helix-turn-helix transcriptional regulator [bacterium]